MSYVEVECQVSERHACRLLGLGRSTYRYRAGKAQGDIALRTCLKELAAQRMRVGYRRLTAMLVREGVPANHKHVHRLYREEHGNATIAVSSCDGDFSCRVEL